MTVGEANAKFAQWRVKAPSDMEPFDGRPAVLNPRATEAIRTAPGFAKYPLDNRLFICIDGNIQMIIVAPGLGRA
jgi:hypothetical protein